MPWLSPSFASTKTARNLWNSGGRSFPQGRGGVLKADYEQCRAGTANIFVALQAP